MCSVNRMGLHVGRLQRLTIFLDTVSVCVSVCLSDCHSLILSPSMLLSLSFRPSILPTLRPSIKSLSSYVYVSHFLPVYLTVPVCLCLPLNSGVTRFQMKSGLF